MLVHLLHDIGEPPIDTSWSAVSRASTHSHLRKGRIRFIFWPEYQHSFSYLFPEDCLNRSDAFPAIFSRVLGHLSQSTLVKVSDRTGTLSHLTTWLSEVTSARFEPLRSLPTKVEWSFQTPDRFSAARELALNGAAFLWPDRDLLLMDPGRENALDVLCRRVHLGGYEITGLKEQLDQHFPQVYDLLRFRPEKSLLLEETYQQVGKEVLISGLFKAWKEYISREYSPGKDLFMVTYGEDLSGVRHFPGVSDFHRTDLVDLGARELCFSQL